MLTDVKILRKLAYEYFQTVTSGKNAENIKLHKAVNDLRAIRPVVLIDELPWNEMNLDDELTLLCENPYLRTVEWFMRTNLYKNRHMPADMIMPPFIPINKVVHSTGVGIEVDERVLPTSSENPILSHQYRDILKTDEDLEKLRSPILTYDREETLRRYNLVGDILGDILPVKVCGIGYFSVGPWDDIARYRGVTNLLLDLADRPEFMHRMMRRFTDIHLSRLQQMEELGLFDHDGFDLHCTSIHTDDLPGSEFNGEQLSRKEIWGRGFAQIFSAVSKDMHEEFDIQYMIELIGQCGLVYYGCCEPLDKKIDIVEKIPNLRKISVTPWADVDRAAEAIHQRYVLSSKPNPSAVSVPMLDIEHLKKEISTILNACKRNNCSCDITLKDISSCGHRPQNLFEWEQTVMDMVRNY